MTNHWIDIRNSDCILAIGSNPAENHPIAFKYIEEAKENGAKLISVDPRFTRTSSKADVFGRIRCGTDIAFIGGLINYALHNDRIQKEYVANYTNASFLVSDAFSFDEGLFSGFDGENYSYDSASWSYQTDAAGMPVRDMTLEHPRSVYQLLKKQYARYTPQLVCSITGTPKGDFLEIADTFCSTGRPDRAGTILYAMGATQSTHGTQNIRSYSVLQLLLGNIGIAGGGINAMRGESNVQGSTDHALLYHILSGYLKSPTHKDVDLASYLDKYTPQTADPNSANWWGNTPKYMVSLLKAYYGEHATADNGYGYAYLPKRSGNYSFIELMKRLQDGGFEGLVCMGQNPAVGGPDAEAIREGLGNLKWLVAVDLWETETSIFWKRPGADPARIQTEVFLLPAASSVEKEGSISNSGRWAQWRYKAVEPVGDARSDLWIIDRLYKGLKAQYETQGGALPEAITQLSWDYGDGEEPDAHLVAREINGTFTRDTVIKGKSFRAGQQVPSFAFLTDDGSTQSGNWLYSGSYTDAGNQMARRDPKDAANGLGMYPGWSWCWPVNRRIIYNRASVDLDGRPFDPRRPVIAWNPGTGKWEGDVPDGGWPPMADGKGGRYPFIMLPEGLGRLFAAGLKDGPFPEHYEPVESPVRNAMSAVQSNPAVRRPANVANDATLYPYVGTTYRVSEHWQAGAMTRNLPWLVELVPDMFVEISRTLAEAKGIAHGDPVTVRSMRGSVDAYALVTPRLKALEVGGGLVEHIGMPWHWGYAALAKGDSANCLTTQVGCANTNIPEYKAFLCNIEKRG